MNDQNFSIKNFNQDIDKQTVMTLGSHCSLQVLKGAKDEGLNTLLVCEEKRINMYKRFKFIDNIVSIKNFKEIVNRNFQDELIEKFSPILIPHGTLISTLNMDELESIKIPIFGNKWILRWESDRMLKQQLMDESKLPSPRSEERRVGKECVSQGSAGRWKREDVERRTGRKRKR